MMRESHLQRFLVFLFSFPTFPTFLCDGKRNEITSRSLHTSNTYLFILLFLLYLISYRIFQFTDSNSSKIAIFHIFYLVDMRSNSLEKCYRYFQQPIDGNRLTNL